VKRMKRLVGDEFSPNENTNGREKKEGRFPQRKSLHSSRETYRVLGMIKGQGELRERREDICSELKWVISVGHRMRRGFVRKLDSEQSAPFREAARKRRGGN